ncbi:hypothetical protein [Mesonia maritima]|uniref:3-hydroxyacyl-[acyl-carrier-protein] dehydratase n=1 Tax=Mesonia maritima TaxID=1793873 RepID=A0ABU1K7U4_9FLAO|nr:hypothetical protein [Mesonia maritima]MDR6301665.1 3-hydroxyacyl-[acyl-carrier-protein] dehydratase [Mesonia maritima]
MLSDLYVIKSRNYSEDRGEAILKLTAKHQIFDGHFPEKPILPGVILVHFFKKEAEHFFQEKLQISKLSHVKFLKTIEPTLVSELQLDSTFRKIDQTYEITGKVVSQKEVYAKVKLVCKKV